MKSRKLKIAEEKKKIPSTSVKSKESGVQNDNPNPLQFDKFLPWVCLQMHVCPAVTVERMTKDENLGRRIMSMTSKSKESTLETIMDFRKISDTNFSSSSGSNDSSEKKNAINIRTYYNNRNQLVEVAIIDCRTRINRKVIQAINLCLPFHPQFNKFKINGNGLSETVLYEIGKLLPHSHIKDVCLDDTYVPEGNYYVLLDKLSLLENLSLCRCKINDDVCKKIADTLNIEAPGSKTLLVLNLTSNKITNLGASYLGNMLRKNRTLLYLNLADNLLDDTGATHILKPLMIFSVTEGELYELRKRKFKYSMQKLEIYNKCKQELLDVIKAEEDKENLLSLKRPKSIRISKPVNIICDRLTIQEQAETMATQNIGIFEDVFDDRNVIHKNSKLYCFGNLRLCYLNLAYNNLRYFSLKKLCEVLKYQSKIKISGCRGLLKVVIAGNHIPKSCEFFTTIESYLENAVGKYARPIIARSVPSLHKRFSRK